MTTTTTIVRRKGKAVQMRTVEISTRPRRKTFVPRQPPPEASAKPELSDAVKRLLAKQFGKPISQPEPPPKVDPKVIAPPPEKKKKKWKAKHAPIQAPLLKDVDAWLNHFLPPPPYTKRIELELWYALKSKYPKIAKNRLRRAIFYCLSKRINTIRYSYALTRSKYRHGLDYCAPKITDAERLEGKRRLKALAQGAGRKEKPIDWTVTP